MLYDYEEIKRRRREQREQYPTANFKLAAHYDVLRGKGMCSLGEVLAATADATPPQDPSSRRSQSLPVPPMSSAPPMASPAKVRMSAGQRDALRASITFYQQLLAYDDLLDEIGISRSAISFHELTEAFWMDRIALIFGDQQAEGKRARKSLLRKYQKLGRFWSDLGADVQISQGIWCDETGAYLVGTRTPMNVQGQENAQVLRRFHVVQGGEDFDYDTLLAELAAPFVRPRQFTVLPYPFHLIDVYVENVRSYLRANEQNEASM